MNTYNDVIVTCPDGFNAALAEMAADDDLRQYLVFDDETGQPTGLDAGKLARFYGEIADFDAPAVIYIRGKIADLDAIEAKQLSSFRVLARGPADAVYDVLANDNAALAEYKQYYDWGPDETPTGPFKPLGGFM